MDQQWINLGGFLGLLAYIVWQDWRAGKLVKTPKQSVSREDLAEKIDTLTFHFNHETTDLLRSIDGRLVGIQDCVKKANNTLQEFREYGVRARKK